MYFNFYSPHINNTNNRVPTRKMCSLLWIYDQFFEN